ncbi:MAG: prepilin-type N-terminal cleavage/methylation domain-containing protein [Candidatus Gracilibacteria bacterium]
MVKIKTKTGAFTLIEVIIAISIFAILAVITIQIFSNISYVSRSVEVQQYVFSEGEAVMEKLIREVQRSAIDYEEYYSRTVLESTYYGQNYGAYGASFYSPGDDGGPLTIPGGVGGDGITGTSCGASIDYFFTEDCEDFEIDSYDSNTGAHYYTGSLDGFPDEANAFCEGDDPVDCDDVGYSLQDELYLIDSGGIKKTIFVPEEKDDGGYAISMLEMDGVDVDGDAISDYWQCASDYVCGDTANHYVYLKETLTGSGYVVPEYDADLQGSIDDDEFEPITPEGLDIIDLHFFITPLEDPYRAFAENDQAVLQHPRVTIVMTVAPSADLGQGLGSDWSLTLQGTASTAVFDVVPSEYKGCWRWCESVADCETDCSY